MLGFPIATYPIAAGPAAATNSAPAPGVTSPVSSGCTQVNTSSNGIVTVRSPGNMFFTPSPARTVKVQADSRAFSASGGFWDMSNPKQPRGLKDPDSTIDISIDWSDWLAEINDSAASQTWTVTSGATKIFESDPGAIATLFISAGTLGSTVAATCRITTNSNPPRTEDRTVYLTIEAR